MSALIRLAAERKARDRREAKDLREDFFQKCRDAVAEMDDGLAGFALVTWGKNGELRTAYNAAQGPIGPALLPTLVSDALNRHVAVALANDAAISDASEE